MKNFVRSVGVGCWFDKDSLVAGEDWDRARHQGLVEADVFLVLCAAQTTGRNGVYQREINEALELLRDRRLGTIYIIPLRLEDAPLPSELGRLQYVDHFEGASRRKLAVGLPLADVLRPDRTVADALAALLEEAARRYAAAAEAPGCLVLEGTRCNDARARQAARGFSLAAEDAIRDYIAARHPDDAGRMTDFVSTTMSRLSAKSRAGNDLPRLLESARLAGDAIIPALS